MSICSPNFLHDTHCRFSLQIGADAICEKPLVLSPHNLDRLEDAEASLEACIRSNFSTPIVCFVATDKHNDRWREIDRVRLARATGFSRDELTYDDVARRNATIMLLAASRDASSVHASDAVASASTVSSEGA